MLRNLFLAVVAAVAVSACELLEEFDDEPVAGLPACTWARVVKVTDGDTIRVQFDGREERVRYIGIDTPEVRGSPGGPEPFGDEASEANARMVEDARVCLERDVSETDRYGRLLRYVWLRDGTLVNEELLRLGLAQITTYPPDVKYVESRYLPAQDEAQASRRGIWGE
ncbi:MAG: thermonuclease family protein [Dehalococcoidia bacterium]|nr:thermonuclease family protein [Dehalococcoidia bacterium]